jgi:nucleoside-diphosphate-sugar epimerase
MIYGGAQENNIQRLVAAIHRWPVFLVPGSGRHLVQPIFVDDVARSVAAAAIQEWGGPNVIPIAGPRPFPWKQMVEICMDVAGRHRPFLHIPLRPAVLALTFVERLGVRLPVDSSMLLRVAEDKNFDIGPMVSRLKVVPREFEIGLRDALARAASGRTGASSSLGAPAAVE